MEPFELIFNNNVKEGIHSGGFSINSVMLKKGISPLKTLNVRNDDNDLSGGGGTQVADLFDSLVVPNWAFTEGKIFGSGGGSVNKHFLEKDADADMLDDDLYEKLLDLVKHHERDDAIRKKEKGERVKKTKRSIERNTEKKGGTKKNKKQK
jgi:hypothetical protein